jgi:hypothetical protein
MDSPAVGDTVKALVTDGNGTFFESEYTIPELNDGDILVRAAMTGVCRSDVAMMQGEFQLLPTSMHGHEGLGINTATGEYVATRGEPAYADYYVARKGTYVTVPELDPKYIAEPVACGINVILNSLEDLKKRQGGKLLIIGTGFLARVAHQTLSNLNLEFDITVVGNSNINYWHLLLPTPDKDEYNVVIDLSERNTLELVNVAENALIIMAAEKSTGILTSFSSWLWKNVTMHFPSPRASTFIQAMNLAVTWTEFGKLNLDNIWTRGYNRTNEWQQAFSDAVDRPEGYNRGYIEWD